LELLDHQGSALAGQEAKAVNNAGTDATFGDVPVTPGALYALKVTNLTGRTIGFYFDLDARNTRQTMPFVVGEVNGRDGPRTGLLSGCVVGGHD
jgi:hypothetical protein